MGDLLASLPDEALVAPGTEALCPTACAGPQSLYTSCSSKISAGVTEAVEAIRPEGGATLSPITTKLLQHSVASHLCRERTALKLSISNSTNQQVVAGHGTENQLTRSKTAVENLPSPAGETPGPAHPCTPGQYPSAAAAVHKAPFAPAQTPPCSTDAAASFSTPSSTQLPTLQVASLSFGGASVPTPNPTPSPSPLGRGAKRSSSSSSSSSDRQPEPEAAQAPTPPRYAPLEVPAEGLIFVSPLAHRDMARASWCISDYHVTRKLYAGYASTVCKATCLRSGQDVVLKAYALSGLSDFLRNQVLRELHIHSRLCNTGVVQLLGAFREGDTMVMVLEYVRGGSLDRARRKLGGRMTEQQALELVMAPLLRTLHYLHTQTIVHRDIKPENLLFTPDWKLKVCDFGVSICLSEERAVTRTGSRDYMAPEVNVCPLKRTPADNKENPQMAYGAAVDVWSVGALAYELLVGFTPFPGGPPATRGTQPAKALPFPSSVSAEAREFVRSCLELHPGDRPAIQQLVRHPWVTIGLQRSAVAAAKADATGPAP
ncbi:hypothetical protein HYH02_012954 [Chlamydomonas schloesseri]|uniref:Protein kinase domain-containing protein n=1 Tax=Chlamydomonas schloesseri TaxID=2026947 RepID=A0A835SS80_9CHLO|nr:hypothetical protein HYH02_012954 [Chlamydomonas schloesseri]|eukprot:KAG2432382.1 hypothetical protein HYH02_012954 [Chlamydomonas schloesseri]